MDEHKHIDMRSYNLGYRDALENLGAKVTKYEDNATDEDGVTEYFDAGEYFDMLREYTSREIERLDELISTEE